MIVETAVAGLTVALVASLHYARRIVNDRRRDHMAIDENERHGHVIEERRVLERQRSELVEISRRGSEPSEIRAMALQKTFEIDKTLIRLARVDENAE